MQTTTFRAALRAALALACAAAAQAAGNDERDERMEETVVTSSRIEMPLREVATSVSVLAADEIRSLGMSALANALGTQPSVGVSASGGIGATTAVRVRGEEGFRTLVLLDGMELSDTSTPQTGPLVEHLLSAGVGRVEILRGAQGMMYGADAGGVVAISSESPAAGLGGSVSAEGGRYGSRQFAAGLGGAGERGDFSLLAVDYRSDGFNARADDLALRDDDGYANTTLHGRATWNASDKLRLQLTLRDVEADNDYDNCGFPRSDRCASAFAQRAGRLALSHGGERLRQRLAASYTDTGREFFSDGGLSFRGDGKLEKYEYFGAWRASESQSLVFGADLRDESMRDGVRSFSRGQTGLYLEYQGGFADSLFVTAGARRDDNDDFGAFDSQRLSAAWLLALGAGELKLKSSYGTGFRAPSLYELGYNRGPFASPPAATGSLREERSRGLDIGLEYFAGSGAHFEAVLFDQRVEDGIFFDLANFSGYLQGSGTTDSSGLELLARLPLAGNWRLDANYSFNDTDSARDDDARIQRPRHLANLGLVYGRDGGRLQARLQVRGSYDSVGIDGEKLDDYQIVNLGASYSLTPALQCHARVENLLDEDYQQVRNYNAPGIAAHVGMRYSFPAE